MPQDPWRHFIVVSVYRWQLLTPSKHSICERGGEEERGERGEGQTGLAVPSCAPRRGRGGRGVSEGPQKQKRLESGGLDAKERAVKTTTHTLSPM